MTTTFSIRFKQCLKEKNIKQAELARSTKITPSSISDWSKGKYVPKRDKLLAIAEFLEVNPDWLVGESDNMEITPLPTSTNNHINEDTEELIDNISKLPILGTICAGDGVYIEEEYDEHIFIDQGMRADFALRVKGDSMIEAGIFDGDSVIVRKQSTASNGEIVIAMTEEDTATCKRFYLESDHVRLEPENDTMDPIILPNCTILGKVVSLYRSRIF